MIKEVVKQCNINVSKFDKIAFRTKVFYSNDLDKKNLVINVILNNLIMLYCNFDKFEDIEIINKLRSIGIKCFERDFCKKKKLDYDIAISNISKNRDKSKAKLLYIINKLSTYLNNSKMN